jgi:hypothetical protein
MNSDRAPDRKTTVLMVAIPLAVILLPALYSLAGFVFASGPDPGTPFLQPPEARFKYCVRDTEYMRFHHWELLREARDEVVREGKTDDVKFDFCRACHPDRGRFCDECHGAANVHPDCFTCHYYPETPEGEGEDG